MASKAGLLVNVRSWLNAFPKPLLLQGRGSESWRHQALSRNGWGVDSLRYADRPHPSAASRLRPSPEEEGLRSLSTERGYPLNPGRTQMA